MSISIRPATAADVAAIYRFVYALAEDHGHLDDLDATEADILRAMFGPVPHAFSDLAEVDGQIVGFCTWFYSWSSWTGRQGLYLEDLFVREEGRGTGAGRALMAALARRCVAGNLARIEWAVMPDNVGGQAFYSRLGAEPQEHAIWRLDGAAMERLAGS
jgi:GNAT superfamily N-acetyltransferase